MRSADEIRFRLRQELMNLWSLWRQPDWPGSSEDAGSVTGPLPPLPDPNAAANAVRGTPYAIELIAIAEDLLQHRFRLLGLEPVVLDPIRWRRDFVHNIETGTAYFRKIPYLDFHSAGDHKIIWELNRHQHLVVLAQAYLLTNRREFLDEIPRQIDSWLEQNPFQRGINWTSALEVAFRAMSWLWVLHLAGSELPQAFRERWLASLYQHGLHLEYNLSVYFSPNTHLLGEAVALHAIGRLIPSMPRADHWRQMAGAVVEQQMDRQVRPDGSHYEQSTYYHLYSVDFFLLHYLLADEEQPTTLPITMGEAALGSGSAGEPQRPAGDRQSQPTAAQQATGAGQAQALDRYRTNLIRMVEYLDAITSDDGTLPLIGDEDGGRLFHPHGDRRGFAKATLATCARLFDRPEWVRDPSPETEAEAEQAAWWLDRELLKPHPDGWGSQPSSVRPPRGSRWFADAGIAAMQSDPVQILIKAGPFGSGSAGHSHADVLSIVAFLQGKEALIDPGTRTYISDPDLRDRYRRAAAHNTVSIEGLEQATPRGPFRWEDPPQVTVLHWNSAEHADILDAECRYGGVVHRRSAVFLKPEVLIVVDRVTGDIAGKVVRQRWLCPEPEPVGLHLDCVPAAKSEAAERSSAFGSSEPARRWVATIKAISDSAVLRAVIGFGREPQAVWTETEQGFEVECLGQTVQFPNSGAPRIAK